MKTDARYETKLLFVDWKWHVIDNVTGKEVGSGIGYDTRRGADGFRDRMNDQDRLMREQKEVS